MLTLLRIRILLVTLLINWLILSLTTECQPIKIDLRKLPKKVDVKLSDLGAIDIRYIPLETSDQSIISRIRKVVFSRSYFLTNNNSTEINMFLYDGSFVSKIGSEGRGPSEITTAHDIDINPQNESIYIVDGWLRKFLVYNKGGKLMRTFKSPLIGAVQFKITNDGILCYNENNAANVENSYNYIDTTGKNIKSFPNRYKWEKIAKPSLTYPYENIFYRFNNQLLKKEIYCDTVFLFSNKTFKPYLIIDVGNLRLTPNARTTSTANFLAKHFITPMNLFETKEYVFYEFIYAINEKDEEGLTFISSKKNISGMLFSSEKGIINDLDGGPNILPKTIKNDNTFVTWIEALSLKTYVASDAFKNSTPKYPDKKKELERLSNSLKATDNPVLVLVSLK
jgi:hypothetical protein